VQQIKSPLTLIVVRQEGHSFCEEANVDNASGADFTGAG